MKEKLLSVLMVLLTGLTAVAQDHLADTTGCDAGWVWQVSGKGLQQKSYLFGTCHGDGHEFTKEEVFGIAGLKDAFDNVEAVLFSTLLLCPVLLGRLFSSKSQNICRKVWRFGILYLSLQHKIPLGWKIPRPARP